jgi:hypothetical protein
VVENDRVVRRSTIQQSEESFPEPPVQPNRNSFLDHAVQPIVQEDLEPLDPAQLAVMVDAEEEKEQNNRRLHDELPPLAFGEATQDPFASLYLSPRSALEATRTIPRSFPKSQVRKAGDVFAQGKEEEDDGNDDDEEESTSWASSNEASLRLASTLGHDVFDAEERSISLRHLDKAVKEAQRSLRNMTANESTAPKKISTESGDSVEFVDALDVSKTTSVVASPIELVDALDVSKTTSVVASPIELTPIGTVVEDMGSPTALDQQELNPTTLAPLDEEEEFEPIVVSVSAPPVLSELSVAPRYNSPKLQNVAAMVEKFIPKAEMETEDVEDDNSASFEGYPSPPQTMEFRRDVIESFQSSFQQPPETPRFNTPPDTPRFEDLAPPDTPREHWDNDEPLPDPPKSEVFSLRRMMAELEEVPLTQPSSLLENENTNVIGRRPTTLRMVSDLEEVPLTQPSFLLGFEDADVSGRRPTTLRGPNELDMPELEVPESFETVSKTLIE